MLSDIQNAVQAEAELNEMNPGAIVAPDESPEAPQVESDQEGQESEEVTATEEKAEEQVELPEDHDPDAVLADEAEEEEAVEKKVPQSRADAKNLAEKWDLMTDEEQAQKIERLRKSGRKTTIDALANELGTSTHALLNPDEAEAEKEDEVEALKAKLKELEGVMGYASQQAELDRFSTQVTKWAAHNKLSEDETKRLLSQDGELRKTFNKAQFNPENGEKLTLNGRLRFALNQTDSVQEMLVNKKAKKTAEELNEGMRAALPGTGAPANAAVSKPESEMTDEEWLQNSHQSMGGHVWS